MTECKVLKIFADVFLVLVIIVMSLYLIISVANGDEIQGGIALLILFASVIYWAQMKIVPIMCEKIIEIAENTKYNIEQNSKIIEQNSKTIDKITTTKEKEIIENETKPKRKVVTKKKEVEKPKKEIDLSKYIFVEFSGIGGGKLITATHLCGGLYIALDTIICNRKTYDKKGDVKSNCTKNIPLKEFIDNIKLCKEKLIKWEKQCKKNNLDKVNKEIIKNYNFNYDNEKSHIIVNFSNMIYLSLSLKDIDFILNHELILNNKEIFEAKEKVDKERQEKIDLLQ